MPLLDRIQRAYQAFLARSEAAPPPPFLSLSAPFGGIEHPFKPLASLDAFGDNPWLYSAVTVTASEAARVPFILRQKKSDETYEEIFAHQALDVLKKPLPMESIEGRTYMTGRELKYLLYVFLLLNGEGFWLAGGKNSGRNPTTLHTLMPANIFEKLGQNNMVDKYVYRVGNEERVYEAKDVIHFKNSNPKNWFRGHSPVKSARWALDSARESDKLNFNRLLNRAVPDGVLTSKEPIAEKERNSLLEKFKQLFRGSKSGGNIGFMPYSVEYKEIQQSNAEMQFAEMKKASAEEILANFRVPPEILGKTDSQTRANAEVSHYIFMRYTILPLVSMVADALTNDYLPLFGGTENMEFSFQDPVPENVQEKREDAKALFSIGAMSPNEARQKFGLDEIEVEGSDKLYIPFSVIPLGEKEEEPVATPVPKEEPDDDEENAAQKKQTFAVDVNADDLVEDKDEKKFALLVFPFLLRGFRKGFDLAHDPGSDVTIDDVLTEAARLALEEQSFEYATRSLKTTREELVDAIRETREEGGTSADLAKKIRDRFDAAPARADNAARTELTNSINDAQFRTLAKEGNDFKEWVTITDGRERESHGAANGQRVPIREHFQLDGGSAMFPGDPELPADERCNCRCDIIGGGRSDAFKRSHYQQFLRLHGTLEDQMRRALKAEYNRLLKRILARIRS